MNKPTETPTAEVSDNPSRDRILHMLAQEGVEIRDDSQQEGSWNPDDGAPAPSSTDDQATGDQHEDSQDKPETQDNDEPKPVESDKDETIRKLEARLQALEQADPKRNPNVRADALQAKAKEYAAQAKELRASGDIEEAEIAERMSREAARDSLIERRKGQQLEIKRAHDEQLLAGVNQWPDLKDPNSTRRKLFDEITAKRRYLQSVPSGAQDALEYVDAVLRASESDSWRAKYEAERKRVRELQAKLQPGEGEAAAPRTEADFDKLPLEKQRAFLMKNMR